MFRKTAFKIGALIFFAFMTWNAYLVVTRLRQINKITALTLESSMIQAKISGVLKDLTDMETGQRGFLITDGPSYLQPYSDAKGRLTTDFADLRVALANQAEQERSLESQIESLANSKESEMERSIRLRQAGYRHRSFMLVDSNEGMEYMNRVRSLQSALSMEESRNYETLNEERKDTLSKALTETVVSNSCLLVLAACLFGLVRRHGQMLYREVAESRNELAMRNLQLEKLTSALSNQALSKTSAIETNARVLLLNYGGFLPRRGHEYAERIKEASVQLEQLRKDLVGSCQGSPNDKVARYDSVA
jgi:CHASE3 domain sensor protein